MGLQGILFFYKRSSILQKRSIIEDAKKSGSLITAEVFMNENHEVFSIPNTLFHRGSYGTNDLLKHGAALSPKATIYSPSLVLIVQKL